jgi:hypothetical protein
MLDANVLVPIHLTDLLLRLAEAETYRPLWSEQVLQEIERNLPKVGVVEPDDFLLDQLDLHNGETLMCLRELVADRQCPPTPMPAFLQQFGKTVPRFVDAVSPLLL